MITVVQDKEVYIIRFPYDPQIVARIKNVPGRKFVPENKYWTIPAERLGFLLAQFKGTPFESVVQVYSTEHIAENATLDATDTIPNVDLSGIPLYVKSGEHLFNHQLDFMKYAIGRQQAGLYSGFILADQQGSGKALSLDTKIYTPSGYKHMRDIQVGDLVLGKDGNPTTVTAVYDHHNVEMYRLTFSDGVTIDCCKDHLWEINDQSGTKVVPTSWFMQKDQFGKLRKDYLWVGGKYKYWIDRCSPTNFIPQSVPIDPYLLGLLLGGGGITTTVCIATPDREILDYIKQVLPKELHLHKHKNDPYSYDISCGKAGGHNALLSALKQLGLHGRNSHTKFIPAAYKYNSVDVRSAVLQGLLDTDGYGTRQDNRLMYTTVSKTLADDVVFLVESLGGLARVNEHPCGYNGKITGISYDLTIKFDNPQEYVRLTRKKELLRSRRFKPRRNIVKVESIPNADARCITVDSADHLYLIEHFVVTHNTLEATNLALYNKKFNGIKHCLIIVCVNSAKYNWISDIKKHTNGEYIPYLLGTRVRKNGNIVMDGSSKDKLEDLIGGHMYGDKTADKLPFFLVMNIEAFHAKINRRYAVREQLTKLINSGYIGMVAIDEIHTHASATSISGKQLLKLKKDTAESKVEWLPMTGTPIVNKPTDLFLPLKLVDGHTYTSYYTWCDHFCVYGGFGGHEIIAHKNIPELKQMLQANMLRRLKKDILDLPPKIRTIEYVENTPYQAELYSKVVRDMLCHRDEIISSMNPMVKFLKLRQVNGSPELVDSNIDVHNGYLEKNAKLVRLLDLVNTIVSNGEKVVIFSNWVETLRTIYQFLAKKYEVCCFTGTMGAEDRERHKEVFINNPDYKILIGTIGALGTSHTLTVANNVIFYDQPWNSATLEQAEDRCHRTGTTKTVNIYSIVTRGTVDEKVYDIIMSKDGVSKYIVDNELSIRDNPQLFDFLLGTNPGKK